MPFYVLGMLMVSKRLHSIYVLRLFNDPIAMMFMYAAILMMLYKRPRWASLLYSLALSVKMNVLLFAPAVLLVLFQQASGSLASFLSYFIIICGSQAILAYPFLLHNPWSYASRSFDFSRVFEFKWTVNWRMVGEQVFLSNYFAKILMLLTVFAILIFAQYKWTIKRHRLPDILLSTLKERKIPKIPDFNSHQIVSMLFTSNLIGIVFSRSLHYQFYSWYFWSVPYLIWGSLALFEKQPLVRFAISSVFVVCLEYCWNLYPSTPFSSSLLLILHFILLLAVWLSPNFTATTLKTKRK